MAPKKRGRAATSNAPSKRTKVEPDPPDDDAVILIDSDNDCEKGKGKSKAKDEKKVAEPKAAVKATSTIHVPVDDYCALSVSHHVYFDDEGTIYDVSLNQTNASNNNNKFYRLQLLQNGDNFRTWTRWGRVGERGQNTALGDGSKDDAFKLYKKKFKEKTGLTWETRFDAPKAGKYVMLERIYEDSDAQIEPNDDIDLKSEDAQTVEQIKEPESKLEKPIQRLMQLIFNAKFMEEAMQSLDYDPRKMPLGKLSKRTITQAYETLKDLSALIVQGTDGAEIERLSNLYFSLIPHDFGRRHPPVISSTASLKKELDLLDSLSDMKVADEIMEKVKKSGMDEMHALDRQFESLKLTELTPLDDKSDEFVELKEYLTGTRGSTHDIHYGKVEIFRLERDGEMDRFLTSSFAKVKNSNKRLLWHGSRATNFGGILSTGLRIAPPEAPVNGYMFSKGLYMADMSTKSANYCMATNSGNDGLLLLCEAELGDPMLELLQSDYAADVRAKEKGALSTMGKGLTAPRQWKDASCVHQSLQGVQMPDVSVPPTSENLPSGHLQYNEYIAYDIAQVRLRYLFRVEMNYGYPY